MKMGNKAHRYVSGYVRLGAALLTACVWLSSARADLVVPAGATINLAAGTVNLGCSDVTVAGTLNLAGGRLDNVRSLTIQSGGSISSGSGSITLSGDWTNSGAFGADTGRVNFVDAPACAASSTISGNSNFYGLSIVSALGKTYRFQSGSTQRVAGVLVLSGTATLPLRIESTVIGQTAAVDLAGSQQIAGALSVRDMVATGQWIALGWVNQAADPGNTSRWFGYPIVPTVSYASLAMMMLGIFALAAFTRRRSARSLLRRTTQ